MNDAVERLVREERVREAAELAEREGDLEVASALFERACDFERAAEVAYRSAAFDRALLLAVQAKSDAIATLALSKLDSGTPALSRIGPLLQSRGDHGWAAKVFEKDGKLAEAGDAWEKERDGVRAAAIFERMGDVVRAARVLETALRRDPTDEAALALGRLLARHQKSEAAVRTLQKISRESRLRRAALTVLAACFRQLGLGRAAVEAEEELAGLGGPLEDAIEEGPASEVKARIFGRYEVIREVASTPSARVLECTDCVRHEHVAVKIFAGYQARGGGRDALVRFEREVRALSALDHPNVVPLRDYIEEGPALVLEWMPKGTLEHMLARESIAPARAVEIAVAVLSAIGQAHRLGILHRDVKPSNVLFDGAGVAHLGDFGVAHLGDVSSTATAGVIGTLLYMSPEQRRGHPATVASDMFGVGAILWEMLTGTRFDAASNQPRTRPSAVHRDLDTRHDAVVARFLAEDPSARPEDAYAARKLLTSLSWASTYEPAVKPVSVRPPAADAPNERVRQDPLGGEVDERTGQEIARVPLNPERLQRARAFARAAHPALQTVLRVDRASNELWLAVPRGNIPDRSLDPIHEGDLLAALRALHQAGIVHGRVDRDHIRILGDEATLLFPPDLGEGVSAEDDLNGVATLKSFG